MKNLTDLAVNILVDFEEGLGDVNRGTERTAININAHMKGSKSVEVYSTLEELAELGYLKACTGYCGTFYMLKGQYNENIRGRA